MKMAKRLLSIVLAVLMLLSLSSVAVSAYTVPDGYKLAINEGNDETGINGEIYGLIGDSDMSGAVNVRDATLIQKFAASIVTLDDVQKILADVNFDGNVNVKDATPIQKWVAGIETLEPINKLIYTPEKETEPSTTAPVVTEPSTTAPAVTEPATDDEPATTAPAVTDPVATEPSTTAPAVTDPVVTEPSTTAPVVTEPASDDEPETTAPVVTEPSTTAPAVTEPATTEAPATTVTVYFTNNKGWENVYIYGFYGVEDEIATGEPLGAYPGTKMTFADTNSYGQDIYSAEVPADIDYIKFADGTDANNRTNNIGKDKIADNAGFYLTEVISGTKWNYDTFTYEPETSDTTATPATTPATGDEPATTAPVVTEPATTEAPAKGITVRFSNNRGWDAVRVHYWGAEETTWPGVAMTKVDTNEYGQDVYEITLPEGTVGVVFNNNNNGQQTVDVTPVDGTGYYCDGDNTPYEVGTYEIEVPVEPTTTEAETTAPVVTEPETTAPEASEDEPATTAPVASEDEPATTAPVVTEPATTAPVVTEPATTEAPADTVTIYFTNNKGWENVYIYGFYGVEGGTATGEPLGAYPGTKMTYVETNSYGQDIYSAEVPADIDYIKFADGTDANNRTNNIGKDKIADNAGFYLTEVISGTKWNYDTFTYEPATPDTTAAPIVTEPATTAPVVTEPVETEPATTAPVVTEPAETEPATTAPVVTEPVVTEPAPTEPAPTEPEKITVYAINSAKWPVVCAYYWGGVDVAWPGTAMTKTGDTVNGFDVYSYTFETAPQNIIFNNNNQGSQTADLTFQAGQYFDIKAGKWYKSLDEVPEVSKLSTDRYLVGSFNGWSTVANEFTITAEGETTAYVEMELEANTTYEFKIVREGSWTSCKTTLNITDSATGLTFSSSVSGNTKLVTKAAGTYVFAFGLETSQLSVTYPK